MPAAQPISSIDQLKPDRRNANRGTARGAEMIGSSIAELGAGRSILADAAGNVIAGNKTLAAYKAAGKSRIRVIDTDGETLIVVRRKDLNLRKDAKAKRLAIADNRAGEISLEWDPAMLEAISREVDLSGLFDDAELLAAIGNATDAADVPPSDVSLMDRFGVPPFSTLDARAGYWQERKRAWLALGIESEMGRGGNLLSYSPTANKAHAGGGQAEENAGTSIFDPVLAELLVRWFSPGSGRILDPFAGGSVRGIVSSRLGRSYTGIDLRAEQCKANREQARSICKGHPMPRWIAGDSREIGKHASLDRADFLMSCPPYADLEQYSDDPADLSNMPYAQFLEAYRQIISESTKLLADDSFAAFVVGEVRDRKGNCLGLVPDTIWAFQDAGLALYNEAILLTQVSSAAIRAARIFSSGRKLCKVHQNVLIFLKGNAKRAHAKLESNCEFGDLASAEVLAAHGADTGSE